MGNLLMFLRRRRISTSMGYLIVYVVAWFAFAIGYWTICDQFYHPNIQQEPAFVKTCEEIRLGLSEAYHKQFVVMVHYPLETNDAPTVENGKLKIAVDQSTTAYGPPSQMPIGGTTAVVIPESVFVAAVKSHDLGLAFELRLDISKDNDSHVVGVRLPLVMDLYWQEWSNKWSNTWRKTWPNGDKGLQEIEKRDGNPVMLSFDKSFNRGEWTRETPEGFEGDWAEITRWTSLSAQTPKLDAELIEKIYTLVDSSKGHGNRIPDSFSRMLYLSVITITTVGYGDILPLTGFARFLTGLEAILGIVILGAFVNAAGFGASEDDKSRRLADRSRETEPAI